MALIYESRGGAGEKAMEGYLAEDKRLDALVEAIRLVLEEFDRTRDAGVAAAGHVLTGLTVRYMQALDRELDTLLEQAGL